MVYSINTEEVASYPPNKNYFQALYAQVNTTEKETHKHTLRATLFLIQLKSDKLLHYCLHPSSEMKCVEQRRDPDLKTVFPQQGTKKRKAPGMRPEVFFLRVSHCRNFEAPRMKKEDCKSCFVPWQLDLTVCYEFVIDEISWWSVVIENNTISAHSMALHMARMTCAIKCNLWSVICTRNAFHKIRLRQRVMCLLCKLVSA